MNLITNSGAGYIALPTVAVDLTDTAGRVANNGAAVTLPTFTPIVAGGKVVSIVCSAAGTAAWLTLPKITITAPTGAGPVQAVASFPAGSLPTATATIGSNGQLTNFTITNAGFGYVAVPTVALGSGSNGGTFISAANAPTARIALFNLVYTQNTAATATFANPSITTGVEIPASKKINALTLGNTTAINGIVGANYIQVKLQNNLEIFGNTTPFSFPTSIVTSPSILDLNNKSLLFSHPAYTGTLATVPAAPLFFFFGYVKNGPITYYSLGANVTRNFPFDAPVVLTTTNASLINMTGATATQYTI